MLTKENVVLFLKRKRPLLATITVVVTGSALAIVSALNAAVSLGYKQPFIDMNLIFIFIIFLSNLITWLSSGEREKF
ncbi:hypothetical protein [Streptococcus sp. DD12]|uniref:hypothetical protein n=1 Tax=Streptococcus sp. DD12 TaxID=1777880 RepID=UPI00079BDFAB|nr:hypothetical protein [Streptococcus sp. DD12]KXT75254.1 hypothetical protein STRDD12_01554 [Streptococcus sp. DD12]